MKDMWIAKCPISDQGLRSFDDLVRRNKELSHFAIVDTGNSSNPYAQSMDAFDNALINNEWTQSSDNFKTGNSLNE